MSTIADYSVFTKAFLTSNDVDFSKKFYSPISQGNSLRYLAVVPLYLETPLTPREALNFAWSKLGNGVMWDRVSCRDANGQFIGNIVRVQPGVREGSIRLVAKVAIPVKDGGAVEDIKVNTFVLLRTDSALNPDLPIAVATISDGYRLHKHLAIGNDPLDDVENANYVSFTINHLNGYTSVDFNPDAYVTYDVTDALSRSVNSLHIAFDTASGDLKLLDKDGNIIDQANLPIKADVIIADGEEGYKYVKTDVKQDIHAAKAWMPEGFTAWEAVGEVPYTMKKAALVVDKGSSRVFVSDNPIFESPISTKSVQFEHVVIGDSTYMLVDKTDTTCRLRKVKGEAEAPTDISAGISGGQVTHGDPSQSYDISSEHVKVDVIEHEGVTYVLVGPFGPGRFEAQPISGENAKSYSGIIVTFGGSATASRVFVDSKSGSYPISTESVQFDHVGIDGSTYMVADKNETEAQCSLFKVKGKAEAPSVISPVDLSGGQVTHGGQTYVITNEAVEADVIKYEGDVTPYVLVETGNSNEVQARTLDGGSRGFGIIVTSEGSSTGEVLGIALADQEGTNLYTFDEGAQPHAVIHNITGDPVRWLDVKPLTAVPNHTLKYGLEAFVWTVKGAEDTISDPFFQQLNASLLALGFHEGDDIALGTNLATLAPTDPTTSPLNRVDADDYIHGETKNESGKTNKELREQEVDEQRAYAKEELVAWNAQHPALTANRKDGTIIDSSGLDVRNGRITLGCGRTAIDPEGGESPNVNYGIRMNDSSNSLEFAVSRTTGEVQFDADGHATNLTSSTLLSIEAGGYISGAPTCLILAQVSRDTEGATEFSPIRTTTGFDCVHSYDASSGTSLKIHDYRDNIADVLTRNIFDKVPAIIEVQAIYTHRNAETVPAQQMHTYIGEWKIIPESESKVPDHPVCIFSCNKIEEWMAAVGLPLPAFDDNHNLLEADVKLYVVIRVY